jgi:hypothetical protein
MGHYFGFNTLEELGAALDDSHINFNIGGTVTTDRLCENHHYQEFPSDKAIAVLWARYIEDVALFEALESYNGLCVINDGYDNVLINASLLKLCKEKKWIYIKHQSYLPTIGELCFSGDNFLLNRGYFKSYGDLFINMKAIFSHYILQRSPCIRYGVYSPTLNFLKAFYNNSESVKKDIDLLFIGSFSEPGRSDRYNAIGEYKKICDQLGINGVFKDIGVGMQEYIEVTKRSKITLSFPGWGPRCRRDWEILMCGSLLYQDPLLMRANDFPFLDGTHFIWQKSGFDKMKSHVEYLLSREDLIQELSRAGQKFAMDCFGHFPHIEWRLIYSYLKEPNFRWAGKFSELSSIEQGAYTLKKIG